MVSPMTSGQRRINREIVDSRIFLDYGAKTVFENMRHTFGSYLKLNVIKSNEWQIRESHSKEDTSSIEGFIQEKFPPSKSSCGHDSIYVFGSSVAFILIALRSWPS